MNSKNKEWVKNNIEKRRAISRKWARNNRPYTYAKKKEYRKTNPLMMNKWSRENPEKKKELNRRWKQENKGKVTASTVARNAIKLKATPKWANLERIEQLYIEAANLGMVVDHIIPLRHPLVCGLHVENNLQLLTKSENCRKSNKFKPYAMSDNDNS